jgi:hypothetical protein
VTGANTRATVRHFPTGGSGRRFQTKPPQKTLTSVGHVVLALTFVGYWPMVLVGRGLGGILIIFIVGSGFVYESGLWLRGRYQVRASPDAVHIIALGLFAAAVISPSAITSETIPRLAFLLLLSIPGYLLAEFVSLFVLRQWVFRLSLLGCLVAVTPLGSSINPINRSHLGSVLVLSTLTYKTRQRRFFQSFLVSLLGIFVLFSTTSLGPVLGFAVGLLVFVTKGQLPRPFNRPEARLCAQVIGFVFACVAAKLIFGETSQTLSGTETRLLIWKQAIRQIGFLPKGLGFLNVPYGNDTIQVYAHNWILDGLVCGGVAGLALILLMISDMSKNRTRWIAEPFLVAMVVGSLVSGGFVEATAVWIVAGIARSGPRGSFRNPMYGSSRLLKHENRNVEVNTSFKVDQ